MVCTASGLNLHNVCTWCTDIIILVIMEIYAAPKLSKYTTALGAYNIKSFTHEINQHMHEYTHTPTHKHTHHIHEHAHARSDMPAHTST